MRGLDPLAAGEVGDGAGDFQDSVVGAGGEGEAVDDLGKERSDAFDSSQYLRRWRVLISALQVTRRLFRKLTVLEAQ